MSDDATDDSTLRGTVLLDTGSSSKAVGGFRLDVLEGPTRGERWESKTERCTVGFHPSCDLAMEDPTVSRFHCEIALEERKARIRDLGSSNGTILDGVRITEAFLKHDSQLRLGRSMVRFQFMTTVNRVAISERVEFGILVGRSTAMRAMFARLERVAPTNITLLLQGETGTGKSACARSVHVESLRKDGPFVMVDCGSIPANLLESELFGHEKGAFTGADTRRVGAFEEASGGTLFLDEIGELPLDLQSKLLSALEDREIRRLGSSDRQPVDVRVIVATNRDLRSEVNAGRFREDLYYRIAVVSVELPPLRNRSEDLPDLVHRLLSRQNISTEQISGILTPAFVKSLRSASWPGNIRELRNYLEQYLVFDDVVPASLGQADTDEPRISIDASLPLAEARQHVMSEFERIYVTELLQAHGGKVSSAAAEAGVDRTYLYRIIQRHALKAR